MTEAFRHYGEITIGIVSLDDLIQTSYDLEYLIARTILERTGYAQGFAYWEAGDYNGLNNTLVALTDGQISLDDMCAIMTALNRFQKHGVLFVMLSSLSRRQHDAPCFRYLPSL